MLSKRSIAIIVVFLIIVLVVYFVRTDKDEVVTHIIISSMKDLSGLSYVEVTYFDGSKIDIMIEPEYQTFARKNFDNGTVSEIAFKQSIIISDDRLRMFIRVDRNVSSMTLVVSPKQPPNSNPLTGSNIVLFNAAKEEVMAINFLGETNDAVGFSVNVPPK